MIHLTFDQDWAPDWAAEEVFSKLEQNHLASTFFITHESPLLKTLKSSNQVELGWHPNFLADSSHGETVQEVLHTMKQWVPHAYGVRSHQLVRSTPLLSAYVEQGLLYDASDNLMGLPHIEPIQDPSGLLRLGIHFEDDVHLELKRGCTLSDVSLPNSGMCVFNFHPSLLALNACDLLSYGELKKALHANKKSLQQATRKDFAPFQQTQQPGLRDLFEELLTWLTRHPHQTGGTLADLAKAHRVHHQVEAGDQPHVWQKPIRIFMTSVGNEAVHGFVDDLKLKAPTWKLMGADMRSDAAGLYRCDERHFLPSRSNSAFLPSLKKLLQDRQADLLLPLSTADQDFFAQPEVQQALGIPIVVSSQDAVSQANRKTVLFQSMSASPELLPTHKVLANKMEVLETLRSLVSEHGAALLKSDQGTGGVGMLCVGQPAHDPAPTAGRKWWSLDEIETWLRLAQEEKDIRLPQELESLMSNDPDDWPKLAVGYLPGEEFSVDVLSENGNVLASMVRLRLAATGGLATVSEVVDAPDVQAAAKTVIQTLGLSYVNNVQFRRNLEGAPQLIEVNPRIPGTISLTVRAGLNLPLAACCLALGESLPLPQPKIGLRVMRHFGNVFTSKENITHE